MFLHEMIEFTRRSFDIDIIAEIIEDKLKKAVIEKLLASTSPVEAT